MNVKEKAQRLLNNMYEASCKSKEHNKACAIVAVNEVLETINETFHGFLDADLVAYWQQVKTEINKL
jgi:hypothetical protein